MWTGTAVASPTHRRRLPHLQGVHICVYCVQDVLALCQVHQSIGVDAGNLVDLALRGVGTVTLMP